MTPQEAIEAAELVEAETAYRLQAARESFADGYASAEADMAARWDRATAARQLKPPPAPWWEFGTDEAQAMMTELHEWVEAFLRPNYAGYLVRLPSCWTRHAEAAWELSTLRAEWIRIYATEEEEDRDLQGALAWLDRFLPNTLARLCEAIKCDAALGCQILRRRQA